MPGVEAAARRPRRLILTLAGTAVTVSGLVAVLIMHATEANPELVAPNDPLKARLSGVVVIISVVLVVFAAVNAIFIAWTTALETRHAASLARALGATTGQIIAGLSAAQILLALIGAALGIPGGIGIYYAFTPHGATTTTPSMPWLALITLATPLVIGLLTTIPTRIGARWLAAQALSTMI